MSSVVTSAASLISALTGAGASLAEATSAVTGLFSTIKAQVTGLCNQYLVVNDAGSKAEILSKIKQVPGVPASTMPLIDQLGAPGTTPVEQMQIIQAIEASV